MSLITDKKHDIVEFIFLIIIACFFARKRLYIGYNIFGLNIENFHASFAAFLAQEGVAYERYMQGYRLLPQNEIVEVEIREENFIHLFAADKSGRALLHEKVKAWRIYISNHPPLVTSKL